MAPAITAFSRLLTSAGWYIMIGLTLVLGGGLRLPPPALGRRDGPLRGPGMPPAPQGE